MTLEQIKERIRQIEAKIDDDEMAHGMEDQLHQDVLQAIADQSCEDPVLCAREALKTLDISFCRWCA